VNIASRLSSFLIFFVALFVAWDWAQQGFAQNLSAYAQGSVSSAKITQRITTAHEVEKLLDDGSRLVSAGPNQGVLVLYYTNDQTRLEFAHPQDPKYKEAILDMAIYDLVCFVSADQHIVCLRPSENSARDVSRSLTKEETDALLEGFVKACGCEISKPDNRAADSVLGSTGPGKIVRSTPTASVAQQDSSLCAHGSAYSKNELVSDYVDTMLTYANVDRARMIAGRNWSSAEWQQYKSAQEEKHKFLQLMGSSSDTHRAIFWQEAESLARNYLGQQHGAVATSTTNPAADAELNAVLLQEVIASRQEVMAVKVTVACSH